MKDKIDFFKGLGETGKQTVKTSRDLVVGLTGLAIFSVALGSVINFFGKK